MKRDCTEERCLEGCVGSLLVLPFLLITGCADAVSESDIHSTATVTETEAPPQNESLEEDTAPLDAPSFEDMKVMEKIQGADEKELVRAYDPSVFDTDTSMAPVPTREMVNKRRAPVGALVRPRADVSDDIPISDMDPGDVVNFCSGTLISPDLFLTAGHCCDGDGSKYHSVINENFVYYLQQKSCNKEEMKKRFVSFNYELNSAYTMAAFRQDMTVDDHLVGDRYQIKEVVEHSNIYYINSSLYGTRFLDYMLLKLDGRPGDKYGYTKLSDTDPELNQSVFVIQHPLSNNYLGGEPKQVSVGKVLSAPHTAYEADEEQYKSQLFHHDADTQAASSGSGILDPETGAILGIHVAGVENGGNDGMPINYLVDRSETLKTVRETYGFSDVWTQDDCTAHSDTFCFNNNVYWYDSCGRLQELKETCDGRCIDAACYTTSGDIYWSGDLVSTQENDDRWLSGTIPVSRAGSVEATYVYINLIQHNLQELELTLVCPNGTSEKLDTRSGIPDAIRQSYIVTACDGQPAAGNWTLVIKSTWEVELIDWVLNIQVEQNGDEEVSTDSPGDVFGECHQTSIDTPISIPDADGDDIIGTIPVSETGTITGVTVDVDITHPYVSDLLVTLVCPNGTTVDLHNRSGGDTDDIHKTYNTSICNGQEMHGDWKLSVSDRTPGDAGTLNSWSLHISYQ